MGTINAVSKPIEAITITKRPSRKHGLAVVDAASMATSREQRKNPGSKETAISVRVQISGKGFHAPMR
ncbi:hypothetical protein O3S81_03645 [Agrobacterium sp. SOY23]|uniref:hypothetical protein n=1 Tax=Agrobacterium sp. SOY23 TaxID=3014555 RepID=UPI0022AE5EA4|nr:hypothetical protein [Agrobacterium sp. SOY23]MCZ4428786.1 hypothetical protein [Agrobacterium sp. SOY23]